jgi:hypothetical protein
MEPQQSIVGRIFYRERSDSFRYKITTFAFSFPTQETFAFLRFSFAILPL